MINITLVPENAYQFQILETADGDYGVSEGDTERTRTYPTLKKAQKAVDDLAAKAGYNDLDWNWGYDPDGMEWAGCNFTAPKWVGFRDALELTDLRRMLNADWYDHVEGMYNEVPTWGPETERVQELISASCAEGDIVSWDTRDEDPMNHRYLVRRWCPAEEIEHRFRIETEAEMREEE